jgi:hypothetical protein
MDDDSEHYDPQDDPLLADLDVSQMHPGSLIAIRAVRRERAELEAIDDAVRGGLQLRSARTRSCSIPYSVRLDRGEVDALERRAAAYNLKPTVLARNLIRMGLAPGGAAEVAQTIDRVHAALEELRSLVGYRNEGNRAPR